MANFDIAQKALETSLDSSGSAMKEHERWSQSLEAKLLKLKATWQSLSQSFMSSDFLKFVLDGVIALVNAIDELMSAIGPLPTIFGAFAIGKIGKDFLSLSKDVKSFGDIFSALGAIFPNVGMAFTRFFSTLKGGKGIMAALGVAAKSLWGIIAAHPILAVVASVGLAFVAFNNWGESAEELSQRVSDLTSKYKENHDALLKMKGDYDTSKEDSMISKYAKLSKGVNEFGENLSLTADEYAEYQSIVDTIANQIPSLVTGYDEQGNAILSYAGNVEKLTEEYENLIHAQNEAIFSKSGDIFKDFQNDMKDADNTSIWGKILNNLGISSGGDLTTGSVNTLDKFFKNSDNGVDYYDADSINKYLNNLWSEGEKNTGEEIINALEAAGVDTGLSWWEKKFDMPAISKAIANAVQNNPDAVKSVVGDFKTQLEANAEEVRTIVQATLSEAFDFSDSEYASMGKGMQNLAKQVINSFDAEKLSGFDSAESLRGYINGILDSFKKLEVTGQSKNLEAAFDLQTKFNGGEISYGEYVKNIQETSSLIDNLDLDSDIKSQIKLTLNTNEIVKDYNSLVNRLTNTDEYDIGLSTYDARKLLDSLSSKELSVATRIIPELSENGVTETVQEIRAAIDREMAVQGLTFDLNLEVETDGIEALSTALAESVTATGLSSDSISALKGRYAELEAQGYDLSLMFEETSNGIHLNRDAYNELEQAYAKQKQTGIKEDLAALEKEYKLLTNDINNCTDAGERAALYTQRDAILQQINDAATLAAQYEGLTSAYNEWQRAESAGSERDMYENILSGFENIDDEISRGWYDEGTIEFLELITGKNLKTADFDELKKTYKGLNKEIKNTGYSVRDFFTVDDDGNSTTDGIYNFLEAIETLEKSGDKSSTLDKVFKNIDGIEKLVQRNDKGEIIKFDFEVAGGDKAIADALGISEELVQIMQRAAIDAGFVATLDGSWTRLADLKTEAEEAANALKKLKSEGLDALKDVDLDFNFNADNAEDLTTELDKALNVLDKFRNKDGSINMKMDGAEEALEVAQYLQISLDKLSEPVYMQLDTSDVDEEFREPLEKLQNFENLVKQKHLLTISGDTEGLKDVEKEMDEIVEYIDNNDDLKAKLKIEGLSKEEIKDKLINGEIEIPATVELQVEMNQSLRDMVNVALYNAGLIDKEELKKRVDIEVYADTVDTSDVEKKVDDALDGSNSKGANSGKGSGDSGSGGRGQKSVVEKTVDIKTYADTVDTSDVEKKTNDAANNKENKKSVVEKKVDVKTYTNTIDTSDTDNKTEDAVKNKSGKKSVVEKPVYIETYTGNVDTSNTEEEIEKAKEKIRKKLSDTIKTPYSSEKMEVIVDFLANTDEIDNYTPEQLNAIVEFIANTDNIESYTPEQKRALVEFFANTTEPDSYTPKEKQAIVDYLSNTRDPDSYTPEEKQAIARFIKNSVDPDSYQVDPKTGLVTFGKDSSIPDNYKAPTPPPPIVIYKKDSSEVDRYNPKNIIRTVTYKIKEIVEKVASGGKSKAAQRTGSDPDGSGVNGTANINGTTGRAFKQGSWGTKGSGTALVGELGREVLVRDGRYYTIGDNGAEFIKYKQGDIIFNHVQSEELFKNGRVTSGGGRAEAFASGTAFNEGAHSGFTRVNVNDITGKVYYKSEDSDDSKESQETLDWIETKLSRIQRAIDILDQKTNNVYKNWSSRNKALAQEIDEVGNEIAIQQAAYNKYLSAANAVGLSSSYVDKIKNGTIDIETITDEVLKEKISDYQNWYEKALECKDAIEELKETEASLYTQRLENVSTQYDGILGVIEHEKNILDEYISQSEAQGWLVSAKYYQALVSNEKDNVAQLKKEQAAMLAEFESAMDSGTIEKGSEAYYDMVASIDDVTLAIAQSETQLKEYAQTLQQLSWETFDLLQEKISSITEETEFLIELMSNKKLYDDKGQLTEEGKSTMGLYGVSYNVNMSQADKYAEEAAKLKKELAKDPYDTELEERYREMISLQQEHILAAEEQKNAIRDMVEEGIELEIDALQELIDKKNEELESAKDLYEYNKQVKEQSEEIASLEKQIAAYRGDGSEESRRKVQELELSLSDAKTDLKETEQDKVLEDTQKMLDSLMLEYETVLNMRLDNIDYLLSQMITEINSDAGIIGDTIRESTEAVGYTLSDSMQTIWTASETNITGSLTSSGSKIVNVVTTYGDKFSNAQTTTNTALNNIVTGLNNVITQLNKKAESNVKKASTSSAAKPKSTSTSKPATKPSTNKNTSSGGDGKPKEGDRVKYISGQYYYDSEGKKPLGSYKKGQYVYITNINNKKWATHPYHISTGNKLGKGDLGWLKLNQISGYATGKKNFLEDELAWTQEGRKPEMIIRPSDGAILTPIAKGDSVLTSAASGNIWDMANNPAEFIKNNLNLGSTSVPNNSSTQNSYSQTIENVTFRMDNVKNYDEILNALKSDRRFEKLVNAMTIDRINGGSSLAKNKSIR